MRASISGMLIAIFLLAPGCGGGGGRYGGEDDYADSGNEYDEIAEDAADEARQAVYDEHGANVDGSGADVSNVDAGEVEDSGNYVCTQDCSGHEAGFEWARDNDVTDSSECGGSSQSFIEGCEAFIEERQAQADRQVQEAADQAAEEAMLEAQAAVEEYEDDNVRY